MKELRLNIKYSLILQFLHHRVLLHQHHLLLPLYSLQRPLLNYISSSMITSTSSFSSPTSLLTSQAIESMCLYHPNAQYIQLQHVTTVTQYVSTEVVERSTGHGRF